MAFHHRGDAGDCAGHGRLFLSNRPTEAGTLADRATTETAVRAARSGAAARANPSFRAWRNSAQSARPGPEIGLLWPERHWLRLRAFLAQDRQAIRPDRRADRLCLRAAVHRRADRHLSVGASVGSDWREGQVV